MKLGGGINEEKDVIAVVKYVLDECVNLAGVWVVVINCKLSCNKKMPKIIVIPKDNDSTIKSENKE